MSHESGITQSSAVSKRYGQPRLIRYGPLTTRTAAGTQSGREGGGAGNTTKTKGP
jgi:hypothetical protein